jgi:hypothetical protein
MVLSRTDRRKTLWIGPVLVALLVTGCAGIEPYAPRDHREAGPERGLFSGADGEFVIYVREDERESVSEARKGTKSTEDNQ